MPYPDGRETKAERHYHKCRGPLGFHVHTGFSNLSPHKVTREFARALWRLGCDVSVECNYGADRGWPRTSIRHLEGMVKQPFASVSFGRWLQTFEGQARIEIETVDTWQWADAEVVEYINDRVDLLVVPAPESREAYLRGGMTIPIAVVPFGVDTTVYQPWPKDEELLECVLWPGQSRRGEKLFLTGGYIQERKGLKECIEAFRLACKQGIEASLIVLNTVGGHGQEVSGYIRECAEDLPVGYLAGGLDEWSMARLYSSVDWFVSCHKREGFGLMPLEAMACGTPAILTDFDGPRQYATPRNSILVPPLGAEQVPVISRAMCEHAIVDVEGTAQAMMRAAERQMDRAEVRGSVATDTWRTAALGLMMAARDAICPVRLSERSRHRSGPPANADLRLSAMGDIGCFAARELRADPGRPAIAYQSRPSAQYGLEAPETGEGLTVAGVRSQSWIDPLECLHLRGAPLGAVRFDGDTSWFAWTVGYYPRGLGLLDVVMWAKANGVPVRRLPEPLEVRGNPPWWDGASGRAEAEERLNAHLAEFDFWWADLLRHIHKTGWW